MRKQAVCAALPPDRFERLVAIATRVSFEPDRTVCLEGDPDEHAFNITEGVARLSKTLPDGRRQVTALVRPGNFVGLACQQAYGYTAEAVTPLKACRFPKAVLEAFFRDNPEMERRVLAMAFAELCVAQSQLMLLGRKTARERLATFLLNWSARPSQSGMPNPAVELPMPRTDIADYLGLSRETVSRTFTDLVQNGIVRIRSPNWITLSQPDRLEEITEGEPSDLSDDSQGSTPEIDTSFASTSATRSSGRPRS